MNILIVSLLISFSFFFGKGSKIVEVPLGINHQVYDQLLQKYVNESGQVNYSDWKANAHDLEALHGYLKQFEAAASTPAEGKEAAASLTNAYNALTLRWILQNYPTKSINDTDAPWKKKRHLVGGKKVSLDQIEHDTLTRLIGYKVHAILVCAAKSCPPLNNRAYTAQNFDAHTTESFKKWLADGNGYNTYSPEKNEVGLSSIFEWYQKDFAKGDGLSAILAQYGPKNYYDFLAGGKYSVKSLPYDWSLNTQ